MSWRWLPLVLLLGLSPSPGWTSSLEFAGSESLGRTYEYDLDAVLGRLHEVFRSSERLLREHVEVDGQYHPGSPDEDTWGRFRLKVYPSGKQLPEDALGADGWFRFSPGVDADAFSFQFRWNRGVPPGPPLTDASL